MKLDYTKSVKSIQNIVHELFKWSSWTLELQKCKNCIFIFANCGCSWEAYAEIQKCKNVFFNFVGMGAPGTKVIKRGAWAKGSKQCPR